MLTILKRPGLVIVLVATVFALLGQVSASSLPFSLQPRTASSGPATSFADKATPPAPNLSYATAQVTAGYHPTRSQPELRHRTGNCGLHPQLRAKGRWHHHLLGQQQQWADSRPRAQ